MPAVKKYTRINFQNYPSTSTPLNAMNLNKMDKGIDDLDDEVVAVKNTIENMSFDANAISYDNTQSGLQATDVQGAVDEINDNLSGFKFYPTGTGIVGLIADDSAYTDEDGNYVVWGTATANQLVEDNPNTYKSVASTEDTRGEVGADTATPFSKELELEQDLLLSNTGGSGISSYTEFSLNGKLSDYRYIKIKAINYNLASDTDMNKFVSNNYFREKTVKVSDFINGSVAYVYFDTSNTSYYATATYVDDEHIGANRSGNSKPSISIFGMN